MSTEHTPNVPLEIISEIFSHVNDDDIQTLSACSQTCTWFREEMQKRIFHSVKFQYLLGREAIGERKYCLVDIPNGPAKRFLRVLASKRSYARWVHELTIEVRFPDDRTCIEVQPVVMDGNVNYPSSFFRIAYMLRFIRKFTWGRIPLSDAPRPSLLPFDAWGANAAGCISRAIQIRWKHLTHLVLYGVRDIPPSLLLNMGDRLDELHVTSFGSQEYTTGKNMLVARPRTLAQINTKHSHDLRELFNLVSRPGTVLSVSKVEKLAVYARNYNPAHLLWILDRVNHSNFRTLYLTSPSQVLHPVSEDWSSRNEFNMNLSKFHDLREFYVLGWIKMENIPGESKPRLFTHIPWFCHALESIPKVQPHQELRRHLLLQLYIDLVPVDSLSEIPWKTLESALIKRAKDYETFDLEIAVTYTLDCASNEEVDKMMAALEKQDEILDSFTKYANVSRFFRPKSRSAWSTRI